MLALQEAIAIAEAQDIWDVQDDLCDCIFQRIGYWQNSYLGKTLEVRMCCIWADLYKSYPQFVRETTVEPAEWNGETEMPKAIWHRQLSNEHGMTVADARDMNLPPPKGQLRTPKPIFLLKWGGEWVPMELG